MNTNANIQKINKCGKLCRIFSKIIMIFCIVGTVLTTVTIFILKFFPEHIGLITDVTDASQISIPTLVIGLCALIASAVFYFFAIRFSQKIETCETPFSEDVIQEMKLFGIVYLVVVLMFGFAGVVFTAVPSVMTIWLLINSFAYGAELQKESDELL